jgi:hypothetical protein
MQAIKQLYDDSEGTSTLEDKSILLTGVSSFHKSTHLYLKVSIVLQCSLKCQD